MQKENMATLTTNRTFSYSNSFSCEILSRTGVKYEQYVNMVKPKPKVKNTSKEKTTVLFTEISTYQIIHVCL